MPPASGWLGSREADVIWATCHGKHGDAHCEQRAVGWLQKVAEL